MLALALVGVLTVPLRVGSAQSGTSLAAPIPFEDVGACPFEGCVYREWTAARPVEIRVARRSSAPVAFRLESGERVAAVTGVVVTVKAGRVELWGTAHRQHVEGPDPTRARDRRFTC
jgi:hypothetical protein